MNKENARAFVLGFEAGEAAEQERIVKMLEAQDSVSGAWAIALIRGEKMTDQYRFEHIENVRDMYRDQGAERERERIIRALEDEGELNYISQEVFDYVVSIIRGESDE